MTKPGIPNEYSLSTACYGTRLDSIEDQAFAAVAMGFRRIELGLSDKPVTMNGFEDTRRETGIEVNSIVCGCLNPRSEFMSGTRLGSLDEDQRERAINSLRRHSHLAEKYHCPTVILRGCAVESSELVVEAAHHHSDLVNQGPTEEVVANVQDFVHRAQKGAQRQIEHLCRGIHGLTAEFPGLVYALEPGLHFSDILNFEAMGWVLDDLAKQGVRYWHDTGTVHTRQHAGLPGQGQWLESYGDRMVGVHLQGATGTTSMLPPGSGEVDFKLVCDYVPSEADKVIEIDPKHGRTEILGAVRFLADAGF